jgi:hypothetical protein
MQYARVGRRRGTAAEPVPLGGELSARHSCSDMRGGAAHSRPERATPQRPRAPVTRALERRSPTSSDATVIAPHDHPAR